MTHRHPRWVALAGSILLLAVWSLRAQPGKAAGSTQTPAGPAKFGITKKTPIEVCRPKGEREYLDHLKCADDTAVSYQRNGSVGSRNEPKTRAENEIALAQMLGTAIQAGQKDFHIVDAYNIECPSGKTVLYLDMYHCPPPNTQSAPRGFTLTSPETTK